MGRVQDKVCVITGAASGMGREDALLLAKEGARVVLTDLNEETGQQLADEIGDQAIFIKQDIASEVDWKRVMAATLEAFGRIDVLVNNAGILQLLPIEQTTLEIWQTIQRVNSDGYFLGCKYAIEAMKDSGGSIINMSSVAALGGMPMCPAYSASKGAVAALSRSLSVHCRNQGYGIRINTINPDGVDTPMVQKFTGGPLPDEVKQDPKSRMCDPVEIANAVLFLASDESRFINGVELRVDNAQLISSL
ncbi:short-chain dehydrogenase [Endozoicomonas montiporae]|uniref:Short-chain dehydrogenase n=2 Tax=Endozoicomonas montiporae TaxID=1027273 RepID=A0A081N820_9GAMM|nr:SDR family oxidoreductase [Endozoicomonas montiporae]AMO55523.1 3-beta-hydroxysteroid dehydrogenase [Endozoicomonas montiporae CL-33]KEQ14593.1 short-chain dehydrogenase [Endozoicomonas montiporae]